MSQARAFYHLIRADFLERIRRAGFLLTLLGAAFLGYQSIVGNITLRTGPCRGVYNSAWVGLLMAVTVTTFVSLGGFYVVKNSVERDRHTRVGEILAATPISKLGYVSGKFLSNLAVLGSAAGVLAAAAVAMQWVRGEEMRVGLWPLLAPFLLIALPTLACVAAVAVLFECLPGLAGGFGNIVFFFAWIAVLVWAGETGSRHGDLLGLVMVEKAITAAAEAKLPGLSGGMSFTLGPRAQSSLQTFVWEGIDWTPERVLLRLQWLAVALVLTVLAAAAFDRFGAAPIRRPRPRRVAPQALPGLEAAGAAAAATHLAPLAARAARVRFGALVRAELKLMLKGQRWWWHLGTAIVVVVGLATPLRAARESVLPFAWLWPALLWSGMGVREERYQTGELVLSSPRALTRQLPALWLAGVLVAALAGGGVGLRLLFSGEKAALLAWLAGALFIPSAALACGVWSGGSRLFEAVYVVVWYVGPVSHEPQLDFMGASSPANPSVALFYLVSAAVLLGLAFLGRSRQLAR